MIWTFFTATKLGRGIGLIIGVLLLIGVIVSGFKLWLSSHDQALLHGYVLEERALTAEGKLAEVERQAKANAIVAAAYQVQYKNLLAQQALTEKQAEADRTTYVDQLKVLGKSDCGLDDNALKFLLRSGSGRASNPR